MEYIFYLILILQFISIFSFKWNKMQVVDSRQLCAYLKIVTWIDITKKAMVTSDVSAWKTKIKKTAKYEKIQQWNTSVQPLFQCKRNKYRIFR